METGNPGSPIQQEEARDGYSGGQHFSK